MSSPWSPTRSTASRPIWRMPRPSSAAGALTTLRKVTIPLVLPAMLAGTLIAILQALTMFGSPAILALPAGFHVITTKIWSLFQFPPQARPRGRRCAAAADHHRPAAAGPEPHPRPAGLHGARRQERRRRASPRSAAGSWLASPSSCVVLSLTVILPVSGAHQDRLHAARSPSRSRSSTLTLHHFNFVFFEFSATQLAMRNTFLLGFLTATIGTAHRARHRLSRRRAARCRARLCSAMLATAPVAIPGIVLGVGLFLSYSHPSLHALRHAVDPA